MQILWNYVKTKWDNTGKWPFLRKWNENIRDGVVGKFSPDLGHFHAEKMPPGSN